MTQAATAASPISFIAVLQARPDMRDALCEGLQALVMPTRQEPGCLDYQLFELTDAPGTFYMRESFKDELALEAHRESAHFQAFAARAEAWLVKPPELIRLTAIR
ncbi:putative quinol monooxygenase [Roseateles depolymerans]|uniref:Monooxygenase n=1 Tax=Roseateles depolymerans TaxID=76731 RepID=A0A0U3MK89_9BURK|nr:putative quinol monooxygenase [Roseateles depolymerans]ALV04762.1 monooxygenase [Roseateles depolymerans]REG15227.1 quinol monooxygenase YgiN [Roseateles depolymerans]